MSFVYVRYIFKVISIMIVMYIAKEGDIMQMGLANLAMQCGGQWIMLELMLFPTNNI